MDALTQAEQRLAAARAEVAAASADFIALKAGRTPAQAPYTQAGGHPRFGAKPTAQPVIDAAAIYADRAARTGQRPGRSFTAEAS